MLSCLLGAEQSRGVLGVGVGDELLLLDCGGGGAGTDGCVSGGIGGRGVVFLAGEDGCGGRAGAVCGGEL